MEAIMSSLLRDNFTFSFLALMIFISLFFLIALDRNSGITLNRKDERRHSYSQSLGKAFCFYTVQYDVSFRIFTVTSYQILKVPFFSCIAKNLCYRGVKFCLVLFLQLLS